MIEGMSAKVNAPQEDARLRDIAGYTSQMRSLEEQRAAIGEKRRQALVRHLNAGISIAAMARACGISEAAVNKLVKNGPTAKAARRGVKL